MRAFLAIVIIAVCSICSAEWRTEVITTGSHPHLSPKWDGENLYWMEETGLHKNGVLVAPASPGCSVSYVVGGGALMYTESNDRDAKLVKDGQVLLTGINPLYERGGDYPVSGPRVCISMVVDGDAFAILFERKYFSGAICTTRSLCLLTERGETILPDMDIFGSLLGFRNGKLCRTVQDGSGHWRLLIDGEAVASFTGFCRYASIEGDTFIYSPSTELFGTPNGVYRYDLKSGQNTLVCQDAGRVEIHDNKIMRLALYSVLIDGYTPLATQTCLEGGMPVFNGQAVAWTDENDWQVHMARWVPTSAVADWNNY